VPATTHSSWFTNVTTLDPRSLAVARISLSLLTLVDLAARLQDIDAFYTDDGVLPRSAFHLPDWDFLWSFHTLSGSRGFILLLFALHAICAVALLVGARTRLATLLCFLFAASLQARNPMLRDGHDDLIRVLLFFGIFLPWGARFSVDAQTGREQPAPVAPSWGAAGFLGQLCLVYWAGAIGKLQSPWWQSGHAITNALSLGRYETHLGHWLLGFPTVLHLLSPLVLAVEILVPASLLWPRRQPLIRSGAVIAMVLLHLSFGACLRLGFFPFASAAAWLAVIPGVAWDRLFPATRPDPLAAPAAEPKLTRFAVIAGLLIAVGGNVLVLAPELPIARPLGRLASLVGLQQYWLLFSPTAPEAAHLEDGYYVEVGQPRVGDAVDLLAPDRQLSWQRPPLISAQYANRRWRHYLANLRLSFPVGSRQFHTIMTSRQAYARFLCRREAAAGNALTRVSIYFLSYRFGHPEDVPTRTLISQDHCD
jgi:hypothetical protein